MIYEKASAVGRDGVLDAIKILLETNGWTINTHAAEGDGKRLHVSKGTLHFSMRTHASNPHSDLPDASYDQVISGLSLMGCTGYDSGAAWDAQPGRPTNNDDGGGVHAMTARAYGMSNNTVTYWAFLYTAPDALYVMIETSPDKYTWLAFGDVEKTGTWTGGAFFGAARSRLVDDAATDLSTMAPFESYPSVSAPSSFIYASYDAFTGWLGGYYDPGYTGPGMTTGLGWVSSVAYGSGTIGGEFSVSGTAVRFRVPHYSYSEHQFSPNNMTGVAAGLFSDEWQLAIFVPWVIYGHRNDGGDFYSQLGKLPHIAFCDCRRTPTDSVITIGGQNFRALPTFSKNSPYGDTGPKLPMTGIAFEVN